MSDERQERRADDRERRAVVREQRAAERAARRTGRDNVVACRLDDQALQALDALVEAGVRSTRSDAAGWLIQAGLQVHSELLDEVSGTVSEIRRLREEAVRKASRFTGTDPAVSRPESPSP
jgi:hypothetical protein